MSSFRTDRGRTEHPLFCIRCPRPAAWMMALLAMGALMGCAAPVQRREMPVLSGNFEGVTRDGRPIRISLHQDRDTLSGIGHAADRAFILSGLAAFYGPIVVKWVDGRVDQGQVFLMVNGEAVTIHGIGETVTLSRGGPGLNISGGAFAGGFAAPSRGIWMELHQDGDMLTGSGFDRGRPVALVGRLTTPLKAEGTLMFGDESRMGVRAELSGDHQKLTINGLGAPIEMTRK